jgi:hypothetical protein
LDSDASSEVTDFSKSSSTSEASIEDSMAASCFFLTLERVLPVDQRCVRFTAQGYLDYLKVGRYLMGTTVDTVSQSWKRPR